MGENVRAGDLTRLVTVQTRSTSRDAIGGQVWAWSTLKSVYAHISPLTSSQQWVAQNRGAKSTHEVTVRYDDIFADPVAVQSSYRILYGSRVFEVDGMKNQDEGNRYIVLSCVEGLSPG